MCIGLALAEGEDCQAYIPGKVYGPGWRLAKRWLQITGCISCFTQAAVERYLKQDVARRHIASRNETTKPISCDGCTYITRSEPCQEVIRVRSACILYWLERR